MINDNFKKMDQSSREEKIRNIIIAKARNIPEENIRKILDVIDIEKQYTITGTNSLETLIRNAYNEDGGNVFQVTVTPIYGTVEPGCVDINRNMTDPVIEDIPAAFIKEVHIENGAGTLHQASVFIYQPCPAPADPPV